MISNYSDLLPLVVPELPGCPEPLILQSLRQAGRDLCGESEAWRDTIEMNIVASQSDYVLVPIWDAEIRRIIEVRVGGTTSAEISPSLYEFTPSTNTLTLDSEPSAALTDGLVVKVALVPTLFANELAGWFMERWNEGVVAGCKAMLMLMPGKKWTNQPLSQKYLHDFAHSVALARHEIVGQSKRMVNRVQFPGFI